MDDRAGPVGRHRSGAPTRCSIESPKSHPDSALARPGLGARRARDLAARHDLLLRGGRGLGMELATFLMGMENMLLYALEDEAFVAELAEMIFQWNRERMMIFLDEGLDLFVRSGWWKKRA